MENIVLVLSIIWYNYKMKKKKQHKIPHPDNISKIQ